MATIGLEFVDAAVIAVREGARVAASPGVALLASGGPLIGEPAVAAARLQPVLASDRFWSDLALDSFAGPAERQLSHADLAHAHLSELWRASAEAGDDAVFALPGSMRLHQAGLLLGIARSIGIPVAGRRRFSRCRLRWARRASRGAAPRRAAAPGGAHGT